MPRGSIARERRGGATRFNSMVTRAQTKKSLRARGGKPILLTRKGLTGPDKFGAIAKERKRVARCAARRELAALDHKGAPDFPRCMPPFPMEDHNLIFFAFDLLFADGQDLRRLPLRRSQGAIEALLEARAKSNSKSTACQHVEAAGCRPTIARKLSMTASLEKAQRPLCSGRSKADQGQVPRRQEVCSGWQTTTAMPLADAGFPRRRSGPLSGWWELSLGRTPSGVSCRR